MMKPIKYLKGDATQPQGEGSKIIAHFCNDIGRWGKGFVLALSRRSTKASTERKPPTYVVYTEPDTPEEDFMQSWIQKWREHFADFSDSGCGCCVHIYEFDAPQAAIDELPRGLIELNLYDEIHRPPRTGSPSNFRDFNRSVERRNKEDS